MNTYHDICGVSKFFESNHYSLSRVRKVYLYILFLFSKNVKFISSRRMCQGEKVIVLKKYLPL